MEFITIQEVSKILKCSTRSVYRKLDKIDTFDNLCQKGFAQYEIYQNGNNRRLFNKEWVKSTLDKKKSLKSKNPNDQAVEILKSQLDIKDSQINAKDNQINDLTGNLNLALLRIIELEKYYHINGMDNSPKLTPTRKQIEEDPGSTLNFEVSEKNTEKGEQKEETHINTGDNKSFSEWIKSM
tara:strand:+ start:1809 stop:2354 length:546 start_codon:yes stop_codon:yes gene_type:complete